MKVINETPCRVAVVPNAEERDVMSVLFVVATTCAIDKDGLRFAPEQRPVVMASGPDGVDDVQFLRRGVSVTVSGFVYPKRAPATSARARLSVGDWERSIEALGARVWRRGVMGTLTPGEPAPFERVAMTWENAYGGSVFEPSEMLDVDGEPTILPEREATYPYNFDGRGFFMKAKQAVGEPLPQLEDPDARIKRWDDRPEPVCFAPYPLWGGLRVGAVFDAEAKQVDLARTNRLTGRACPRLTFGAIAPLTKIRLEGMRPDGEALELEVIDTPATIAVHVGDTEAELTPALDCIEIDAEACVVRFVHRHILQYGLVQHEAREARVIPTAVLQTMEG